MQTDTDRGELQGDHRVTGWEAWVAPRRADPSSLRPRTKQGPPWGHFLPAPAFSAPQRGLGRMGEPSEDTPRLRRKGRELPQPQSEQGGITRDL